MRAVLARLCVLCALLQGGAALSHENLPASLLLQQTAAMDFDVRWRVPATQGVPAIAPRLPGDCAVLSAPVDSIEPGARVSRWQVRCATGLDAGTRLAVDGLPLTMVDVVVRVAYADGRSVSAVARPAAPEVVLPARAQAIAVAGYFQLGIEHILGGIDHLLFVLCLILLVPGRGELFKTITAFTVAHSVTLALAVLGAVHVPQAPVEATIALSILYLARELAMQRRSGNGGLAARCPWLVAFAFGLLHGFGFSAAMAEVGLPQQDIVPALLLFNFGVEAGQLAFVVTVYGLLALARRLPLAWTRAAHALPIYAIGAVAAFWWLQRMAVVTGLAHI